MTAPWVCHGCRGTFAHPGVELDGDVRWCSFRCLAAWVKDRGARTVTVTEGVDHGTD